ncbi:glycosyltransferase family 2 protein [Curtobacterium sp. SP.BCp]|uniref:glycosyltransferase family 2 protein n=1 Tax=Curtobacterium sp. SP.BCp TaxID=3435230 RepID=UPI003F73CA0E
MTARRGVLVVVPVYGDLPSVLDCLGALAETVEADRDRVLIVNDCGPDVDAIERAVVEKIAELEHFRYERNAENLGFVGTCNRAVGELDRSDADVILLNSDALPTAGFIEEMLAVLDADERHGAVTARSNNATVASLPYRQTNRGAPRTFERTATVHAALREHLPQWYVAPTAMGFCLLIRRSLIERFGLFDDVFAPGYGEENDFCMRIGAEGYRSLMANRALVFHAGSASFASRSRNALRAAHQKVLEARYPNWAELVRGFVLDGQRRVDHFADAVVPTAQKPRVALDLRGVPAGTAATLTRAVKPVHQEWDLEVVDDSGEPNADDLVTRIVMPLSSALSADRFRQADARGVQLVLVDDVSTGSGPDYDAVRARRADALRRVADQVVPDADAIDGTVPDFLGEAFRRQAALLETRHDLALSTTAEKPVRDVRAEAERAKAVQELADVKASRSYRLAQRISRAAALRSGRRR